MRKRDAGIQKKKMHGKTFTIKSTKPTSSKLEPIMMFGGSPTE
jgi:hypothetical protein